MNTKENNRKKRRKEGKICNKEVINPTLHPPFPANQTDNSEK